MFLDSITSRGLEMESVLYIYPLDVEPAAMLQKENKQYTVKRSEPRYNRGVFLIYSLISSLLREPHDTLSLILL